MAGNNAQLKSKISTRPSLLLSIFVQTAISTHRLYEYMGNKELAHNKNCTEHTYRPDVQKGFISTKAVGFAMYVRQEPKLLKCQYIELNERNGVSFERELNAL